MKPVLIIYGILLSSLPLHAQSSYTEKLRKNEAGKGSVVINQSPEIEKVVNNAVPSKTGRDSQKDTNVPHKEGSTPHGTDGGANSSDKTNSGAADGKSKTGVGSKTYTSRARHKARGFRICIFTGGNSRADKTKATQMGNKCRDKFPELAVYPSFIAPRWVTHVGDFKTRQEAQKYVNLIRKARFTYEVRIVASEVNIPY